MCLRSFVGSSRIRSSTWFSFYFLFSFESPFFWVSASFSWFFYSLFSVHLFFFQLLSDAITNCLPVSESRNAWFCVFKWVFCVRFFAVRRLVWKHHFLFKTHCEYPFSCFCKFLENVSKFQEFSEILLKIKFEK